jgi:hypothetical protein
LGSFLIPANDKYSLGYSVPDLLLGTPPGKQIKRADNLYIAAYFSDDVCRRTGYDAADLIIEGSKILARRW